MHHESRIKCCKCNAHLCIDEVGSALLVSPPSHKGLVTRNTNVWPNVEAMQRIHDIINYVIASSEINFIDDVSSLGNLRKNLQ